MDLSVPVYYKKARVGGVDLNAFLPFESANFDVVEPRGRARSQAEEHRDDQHFPIF
jgi:hypothetical protein